MHLTKFGFNVLVVIYLAPLMLINFIGNTVSTGWDSDYYYYKSIFDGCLIAYALWQLTHEQTASVNNARARQSDHSDDVIGFEKLGAVEYLYCALLSVYAAVNWWILHAINQASTGLVSMLTMIWSLMSIAVCILAAVQFYHIKSGAIVALKKKVVQ